MSRAASTTPDALAKRFKLDAYAGLIRGGILPAFKLQTAGRGSPGRTGAASKFGGEPWLAWDEPWPSSNRRPLHFLAHIRLSELPKGHLPRGLLPERGWLRLWLDTLGYRMEDSVDPSKFHVTFEPDESRPLQPRPWPCFEAESVPEWGDPWRPFPEARMTFKPILCLDHRALKRLMAKTWAAEGADGLDRVFAFLEVLQREGRNGNHRLLGDVIELQSDMREECERHAHGLAISDVAAPRLERTVRSGKGQWRLLARLDSQTTPMDWC